MTDAEYIEMLYTGLLNRHSDMDGLRHWSRELAGGTPREDLLRSFLRSNEYRQQRRADCASPDVYPFPLVEELRGLIFPLVICDVGAMTIAGEAHAYTRLLETGECRVIGFEPVPEERDSRQRQEPGSVFLSDLVGDGEDHRFHVVNKPQYSSLLEPDFDFMQTFAALGVDARVVKTECVKSTKLDDLSEVRGTHFLKLDVQGGELFVIRGARRTLMHVAIVHVEVEFARMYRGQPLFRAIDSALEELGFEFINFSHLQRYHYKAGSNSSFCSPCEGSRLLWADAIYLRRPAEMAGADVSNLIRAAYMAHVNYGMYDLAAHLLAEYDARMRTSFLQPYASAMSGLD